MICINRQWGGRQDAAMTNSVERHTYRMLQVSHRFQLALRNQRRRFGSHFLLEAFQEPFDTNVPFYARHICSVVGPSFVKNDSIASPRVAKGFDVRYNNILSIQSISTRLQPISKLIMVMLNCKVQCFSVGSLRQYCMETVGLVSEPGFSVQFAAWTSFALESS